MSSVPTFVLSSNPKILAHWTYLFECCKNISNSVGVRGGRQLRLGFKPGHSFFLFLFSTLLFVFRRKFQFVSIFLSPLKYCIIPFEQRKNRPKAENIGKHLRLARIRLPCFVFTVLMFSFHQRQVVMISHLGDYEKFNIKYTFIKSEIKEKH